MLSRKEQSTIEAVFLFPLHNPMFSVLKKEKQARLQPSCPSGESSLYLPMYFAQFRLTLFDMNICDQHMSNPKNIARIAKAALQVTQLTCKFMFLKNNNTSEETLTKVLGNGADPQKDGDHRG